MDPNQKRIIVREIDMWRKNRLLPEQYCDFLLNLYMDDPDERSAILRNETARRIANSNWKNWLFALAAVMVFAFVLLHFNSFSFPLQIAAAAFFTAVCYGAGVALRGKHSALSSIFNGAGSAVLLGAGIYLLRLYELDEAPIVFAYVAFCGFVWIIMGIAARAGLMHFCGWTCLILVYAAVLNAWTELDWIGAQTAWLPLCAIFGWLGWLMHRANKTAGRVLLLACFLLWWMPEAYSAYAGAADAALLQTLVLAKLVIAAAIMFLSRNKWIEWIA